MALNAATVWEVRTTGDDTNGGGWYNRTNGTSVDYTQQDAAQLSLTDLACASNTTLTSATGGFTAAMVGSLIHINSGTNAAVGFYEITAYTDTNTVTIDRTCATGGNMSSGAGKVGGALVTRQALTAAYVAGNKIWIKTGTYTNSTTCTLTTTGSAGLPVVWEGYGSARGDMGAQPVITSATNSVALWSTTGASWHRFINLKHTHTAATRGPGFLAVTTSSNNNRIQRCTFDGVSLAADDSNRGIGLIEFCDNLVQHTTSHGLVLSAAGTHCLVSGNVLWDIGSGSGTAHGIAFGNASQMFVIHRNIFAKCTGCGVYDGSTTRGSTFILISNTFADNTAAGAKFDNGAGTYLYVSAVNNLFWGNGTYGLQFTTAQSAINDANSFMENNAYGSNATANIVNVSAGTADVTGVTDPFVTALASRTNTGTVPNYGLNVTAGAGAACRATGYPGAFTGGTPTGYLDIGAVQHADPAGGGTTVIVIED